MTPILETERLFLCRLDAERDFEAWAQTVSNPDTVQFLHGHGVLDREAAWQNLAAMIGHWDIRGFGFMSMIAKDSGTWIGRCGPYNPLGWPEPEVGWMVHPAHVRQGYAFEAATACVNYCFDTLGWDRVAHVISETNTPSIGLAEKLGAKCAHRIAPKIDSKPGRLVYRHETRPT